MVDWITVKDLAEIQGITPRAVRKAIAKNKYVTRIADGTTGKMYEILVSSLDDGTQKIINFEKSKRELENIEEPKTRKKERIPLNAHAIALARFDLVNLWVDFKNNANYSKTIAGDDFINIYNEGKVYPKIFKTIGRTSSGTIYRWHKMLDKTNDYTKLIPGYDYGESEDSALLPPQEEMVFKSFLLSPNKTNIGKAIKLTKYILKSKGIESSTSERTYRRYANNYKKNHYDQWVFAREGEKALKDKVQPYITRDISKLEVGDVLVADGHRLAIQCINPFTGKPCRLT